MVYQRCCLPFFEEGEDRMESKELKTAQIFSSNMVLQRNKNVTVWGEGTDGKEVQVSIKGNMVRTIIKDGKWILELPKMQAGGPYVLTVTDGDTTLSYKNVMVGEVWFAGGQSNMELELQNCMNGRNEMKEADYDSIRFYNVAKIATLEEKNLKEEATRYWELVKPDTCASMSAVAYFFARKVQKELGITIGIIDCYWGGTSISCWMDKKLIEKDMDAHIYLDEWKEKVGDKTDEQFDKEMEEYMKDWKVWDDKCKEVKIQDPMASWEKIREYAGDCPWPQPFGNKSQFRPGGLYETMIKRVTPYTIKGFLWYQGEEDESKPYLYDKMLYNLIHLWRSDWKDETLPFMIVQLPMWIEKGRKDDRSWAVLRDMQRKVAATVKNAELTVLIDCGEYDNIHPLDKQTVGYRLALQTLESVYGIADLFAKCPTYKDRDLKEDKIVLYFDSVYGGFEVRGHNKKPELFEIAGEDKVFVPAEAEIDGETIIISSKSVKNPKYARYAWVNYGIVNLFSSKGMPVAPFETK